MSEFGLSKAQSVHEDCIRDVLMHDDAHGNSHIVTISRDCTAKVFRVVNGTLADETEFAFYLPSSISSGAIVTRDDANGSPTYVFGCMDGKIYVYTSFDATPTILSSHSQNVCILKANSSKMTTRLASGSWDKTAVIYDAKLTKLYHITAHSESVNDVLFVAGDRALTASSDKQIFLWDISQPGFAAQLAPFPGHEDCVRSLLQLENVPNIFFSSSNDQTVRSWNLNAHTPLCIYAAHSHFIFKIAQLDTMNHFLSAGEDKTICIWHKDKPEKPVQIIKTPIATIWSMVAIDCYTFVVAASDGRLYVFSNRTELKSTSHALFDEMTAANQVIPFDAVRHLRVYEEDSLPSIAGIEEGEQRLIRSTVNNHILVYQWSSSEKQWKTIGHVSDYEAHDEVDQQGRVWFNGDHYDQVLNVRLDKRAYKLALNRDQNSWEVAKHFLDKHRIDAELLEQIVRSIVVYANYKPKKDNLYGYFPIYDFVFFEQSFDAHKFAAKLREFNDKQDEQDLKLDENTLALVVNNYRNLTGQCSTFVLAFKKLLSWKTNKFIVYDLLRLAMMDKFYNSYFLHYFPHETLLACLQTPVEDMPTQLTCLRVMANVFNTIDGCQFMYGHHRLIATSVMQWSQLVPNANVQVAFSAVWYNFSILLIDHNKRMDYDFAETIMEKVMESTQLDNLPEKAIVQVLYAFGNILAAKHKSEKVQRFLALIQTYPSKFANMNEVNNVVQHVNRFVAYNS